MYTRVVLSLALMLAASIERSDAIRIWPEGTQLGTDDDVRVCPPGAPTVTCPAGRNLCDGAVCEANPSAICISKPCDSVYRGRAIPACSTAWVDATTGDLVDCGWGHVDDINECVPTAFRATCPPAEFVCRDATCPSDPAATCTVRTCTGVYRGVYLNVDCQPLWHNPTTGALVDCMCSECGFEYAPVCGQDGETYPSRCIADCLGKPVASEGKCHGCTDANCAFASQGELCSLFSGQCLGPGLSCLRTEENSPASAILGRCGAAPR